jgi:hypothetical protein
MCLLHLPAALKSHHSAYLLLVFAIALEIRQLELPISRSMKLARETGIRPTLIVDVSWEQLVVPVTRTAA